MEKIDFDKISSVVEPSKKISFDKNKHRFRKVAFDVFQMENMPFESYWVLEKDADGREYLVAMYEEEHELKSEGGWTSLSDKTGENITVSYKDIPVKSIGSKEFHFKKSDIHVFKKALTDKLNEDKVFADKLLNTISGDKRDGLLKLFPELATK